MHIDQLVNDKNLFRKDKSVYNSIKLSTPMGKIKGSKDILSLR